MSVLIDNLMRASDAAMRVLPRRKPAVSAVNAIKLISHRGIRSQLHAGEQALENTFAAMDPLVEYNSRQPAVKIWGIECDVRWTKDLEPVIFHDPDLKRVLNCSERLQNMTFKQLRSRFPQVPHVQELAERYGGQLHLMLEVKSEHYPDQAAQNARLLEALGDLIPQTDFHLYSFDTELLDAIDCVPAQAKIAIAMFNRSEALQHVLDHDYAGLGAHFTVMNADTIQTLNAADKHACVGMVDSRNSLYREINRGSDWLFSNDAIRIAQHCERLLLAA